MRRDRICGCYVYANHERTYLPQVKLDAHTTILSTASRTVLTQTFVNYSSAFLQEIRYAFPLYDGVSIVDFCCQIGERTIYGLVKEKHEAKKAYDEATERGENAALLEQLPDAADVFTTTVSNVPRGASVQVTITYVQELKHDAEVDGVRLNIPTNIAPRYGDYPGSLQTVSELNISQGLSLTVDIDMVEGNPIKKIISPSHPIQVTLGSLSTSTIDEDQSLSRGSATLALGTAQLTADFILQVVAKDIGAPQAILETHPTLPNQRALMATLVPKFNLKSEKPEIILIADRSGSMQGPNMSTLKAALKVFLKSIPLGCTFNICSFGSVYKFLWHESQVYDERTLAEAIAHVETFESDFGGTETLKAVEGCFNMRKTNNPTEMILLTDGDMWGQQEFFSYVSKNTVNGDVRIFPLGIGRGVSSALIEGVARVGRGFAQMVADNEKMDRKIVRMLKGALTPHIHNYRLEVKYEDDSVDTVADSLRVHLNIKDSEEDSDDVKAEAQLQRESISLYDPEFKEEHPKEGETKHIFAGLPDLKRPALLQTPHEIPALFAFHRTDVYLLMAPDSSHLKPKSVVLKATCPQGPLELEIPVQSRKNADAMIHQLAARKAIQELEEGRGWISDATVDDSGVLLSQENGSIYTLLQRHEAVRLGVEFQVGGKYCSFVAVEANEAEIAEKRQKALQAMTAGKDEEDEDWEVVRQPQPLYRRENNRAAARRSPYQPIVRNGGRGGYGGSRGSVEYMGAPSAPIQSSRSAPVQSRAPVFACRKSPSVTQSVSRASQPEETEESDEDMGYGLFDGDDAPASPPAQTESLLRRLIALQSFSGPWPSLASLLSTELHIDMDAALAAAKTLSTSASAADQILATALVITFLEQKMPDEEDTWELVVEKGRTWLQDTVEDDAALAEVWRVAQGLLSA